MLLNTPRSPSAHTLENVSPVWESLCAALSFSRSWEERTESWSLGVLEAQLTQDSDLGTSSWEVNETLEGKEEKGTRNRCITKPANPVGDWSSPPLGKLWELISNTQVTIISPTTGHWWKVALVWPGMQCWSL